MITFLTGNIFDSTTEALVNPVNCKGVMGAGLAAQFKRRFPANFTAYKQVCDQNGLVPGKIFVFTNPQTPPTNHKYIINFPTKDHWKHPSSYHYISDGLITLAEAIHQNKLSSIAIPALGAGCGGLDWVVVKAMLNEYLSGLSNTRIEIYEPTYPA